MKKTTLCGIIVLLLLITIIAGYCIFTPISSHPSDNGLIPTTLTPNVDGFFEVRVPITLMAGLEIDDYIESLNTCPISTFYHDMIQRNLVLNQGEYLLILYPEIENFFEEVRYFYYYYMFVFSDNEATIGTWMYIVYEDDLLRDITVYIRLNKDDFFSDPFLVQLILGFSQWAGHFQLLSGVPADEWGVTITVLCYDTGELVSQETFPHEGMFDRVW